MTTDDETRSYLAKLHLARDAYERDHPEWRHESLLWILQWGLSSLRKLLETNSSKVSWTQPFIELRFPVECNWTPNGEAPFVVTSGKFQRRDLRDENALLNSLTRMLISQLEIETLQDLTNNAVYVREGGSYRTMFSADQVDELETIESDEERNKQVRELLKPFSFGGGSIDLPSDIADGATIPEAAATQLSAINPPLIMIPAPSELNEGEVATIFEIQPMVADLDQKKAYFPIIVGLTLFPAVGANNDETKLTPGYVRFADWTEQQRDELWKSLATAIADHLGLLGPVASKEIGTAILTVNAQIQVKQLENETLEDLRRRALTQLQEIGAIVKFDSEIGAEKISVLIEQAREALGRVEGELEGHAKGRALEDLMAALFGTIKGFGVTRGARTETEEIDLVIINSGNVSEFEKEGPMILVECKNWSGKSGKAEFVLLKDKMRNRGERCTLGFLISWNGFAETITKEMLRSSQEKLLIVPLTGDTIREAVHANTFLECICDAWKNALLV